ncbi:MAG: glycosyltransferase [Bacteroidales bacterium]|nr:glycosyltransferase [Bacteroidales bacterium]
MIFIVAVSVFFAVFYSILILAYTTGWHKTQEYIFKAHAKPVLISVIIPARNEENNIVYILNDLFSQKYPKELYEVIVIDDHSNDSTFERIKNFGNKKTNIKIFRLPDKLNGKKHALNYGINKSSGELILVTDADCRLTNLWIATIASFYQHKNNPDMIIGLVNMQSGRGILSNIQEADLASLAGVAAGSAAINKPVLCNGANLAFKKSSFETLSDPFEKRSVSGDDVFLLQQFKKNKYRIMVIKNRMTTVTTLPVKYWKDFLSQRLRWASKSKYYSDREIILTGFTVVIFNYLLIVLFILQFFANCLQLFLILFTLKLIVDSFLVIPVLKYFGKSNKIVWFFLFELVYPVYSAVFSLWGIYIKSSWKGRSNF